MNRYRYFYLPVEGVRAARLLLYGSLRLLPRRAVQVLLLLLLLLLLPLSQFRIHVQKKRS